MRHFTTLKFRLLGGSVLLILLFFGAYSTFAVWNHERQLMAQVHESADRISEFIKSSTHYSMLLNRKEDVYRAMQTLGTQTGVEGLRIYNKRGMMTFSTDSSERGEFADLKAEACIACHAADQPLESLPTSNRIRIYDGPKGRVLGLINPIRNEPSCASPQCHESPAVKTILGVLDVRMSLNRIDAGMATVREGLILVALALIVCVSVLGWLLLNRTVLRPIHALTEGTRQVSDGNLDFRVSENMPHELAQLVQSFNLMTGSVKAAQREIKDWSESLERRVKEKTEELTVIHHRIAHVEKMASLGRLSATVAHELNNPLEAILTYTKLLRRQLHAAAEALPRGNEWREDLDIIARETQRCGEIVKNLLLFSKKESGEFVYETLAEILDRSFRLMKHHFEMRDIRYVQRLPDDPVLLLCDPQQIQQALVAMYVNAADAMAEGGTLEVSVEDDAEKQVVLLAVKDSGGGIEPDDLPHVFEPFFTTKEGGQGVGLGLSVVYGITERHGGTISVESAPGEGTMFRLSFPRSESVQSTDPAVPYEKEATTS